MTFVIEGKIESVKRRTSQRSGDRWVRDNARSLQHLVKLIRFVPDLSGMLFHCRSGPWSETMGFAMTMPTSSYHHQEI